MARTLAQQTMSTSEDFAVAAPSATHPPLDARQLFKAHFSFVWRLLRRLGVPPALLDDAMQDVFLVIHRRNQVLTQTRTVKALLAGIAFKVARNYRRRAHRQGPTEPISAAADQPAVAVDPEQAVSRAQALQRAQSLLDALSEEQKTVFAMVEIEGLSGPEVAEALEISVNTVYSRLRLAREMFNRLAQASEGQP